MTRKKIPDTLAIVFACLGPFGRVPIAPGTAGSAAAALLAPWLFFPLSFWGRVIVLALIFLLGSLAAGRTEKALEKTDPGCVIIDEVLGQWITFLPFVNWLPWQVLTGFCLFRFFDILKPWPVRNSERWLPGGFGVMIDDVLAGSYAALVLWVVTEVFT